MSDPRSLRVRDGRVLIPGGWTVTSCCQGDADIRRTDKDMVCPECDRTYIEHPRCGQMPSLIDGVPFLHVVCKDGLYRDHVKL